jgi:phosphatidylserine/phosphatidylglycerophosphate/cardiolipin synthase-like enzyme
MKEQVQFSSVGSRSMFLFKYLKENDHSKVFLFDENTPESIALIGGMNIGDEYLTAPNHEDPESGGWHDYMVIVHGELADRTASPSSHERERWLTKKIRE